MFNINIIQKNALRRMRKIKGNLENLPWLVVGEIYRQSIHRNFIMGGRPTKWRKRKKKYPWPILRKSDTLKNAHYVRLIPNGVAVGNPLIYARAQFLGRPEINLVARNALVGQPADRKKADKVLRDSIIV